MLKIQPLRRLVLLIGTRRGSMLIMVIVILVLLALIGTAMMSSARIDRVATAQNSINTQVDLLLESAKNFAKAAIQNDLYGTTSGTKTFRSGTGYLNYDSVVGTSDTYLASRLPVAGPLWPFISQLPNTTFESPAKVGGALTYSIRQNLPIGSQSIGGVAYPAFGIYIAGDADGDGIVDSGLVKFPIGEINGVTYYYSVRILDNSSAINASTAWSSTSDYSNSASTTLVQNFGFFPSSVGFGEFLTVPTEMGAFNQYRLGKQASPVVAVPVAVTENGANGTHGTNTTDFVYVSLGDLMNNQIAKRIANTGYYSQGTATVDGVRCNALPITDSISLAYKFCTKNPFATPSILESTTYGIPGSVYTHAGVRSKPYLANDSATWYTNNFNFATPRPMRTHLVARNPVSEAVQPHDTVALNGYTTQVNPIPANGTIVNKTSVNTASFNYLWRAFWNVMATTTSVTPPYSDSADGVVPIVDGRMFRSVLRDPRPTSPARSAPVPMTSSEVMMLRSSIAALNTMAIRGTQARDYTIPSRRVFIRDSANLANFKYEAMVYGGAPQPFISEVYANTNPAYGAHGYVAIELYNPYDFAISLANYNLGVIYRPATATTPVAPGQAYPSVQMFPLTAFLGFGAPGTATLQIPAKGRIVIDNFGAGTKDTLVRPVEAPVTGTPIYVPNLSEVFSDPGDLTKPGGELVLLRPRRQIMNVGGTLLENDRLSKSTNNANFFDETLTITTPTAANLIDLVPVDQFDFTGLAVGTPANWHYVRQSDADAGPYTNRFKQVYPGKYTVSATANRNQGTELSDGTIPVTTPPTLGAGDLGSTYSNLIPPVQWMNTDLLAQYRSGTTASTNKFPYGGFARNGDMLQIPFIGSYRIRQVDPTTGVPINPAPADGSVFLEMNSVTMDASLAEDGESADDANEMLGRFCPLNLSAPGLYIAPQGSLSPAAVDYYSWASSLFEYLTVSTPSDDYFPNVDPGQSDATAYGFTYSGALALPTTAFNYPLGAYTLPTAAMKPGQVKNGAALAQDSRDSTTAGFEQLLATEGRIGINTASAHVLEAIPWVPSGQDLFGVNAGTGVITAGADGTADNLQIAAMIAAWRDGSGYGFATANGPFTSIMDLNKIVAVNSTLVTPYNFANCFGAFPTNTTDSGSAMGDIYPTSGTPDTILNDFEQRFLMFNRVSNLVTTRSDSFTVYVLVQGWKNAGTASPELVATRRAALIVDRSAMSGTSNTLNVSTVPAD